MHHDGTTVLNEPRGYTPDADEYRDFLECGLANFGIVNGASPNGVIGATQGKDEGK
jgi:hypothetical protein